jgi:hypothetical protein
MVKRMRKKTAEEIISKLESEDEVCMLGNGKIPNVMGRGQLCIASGEIEDAQGDMRRIISYRISDTHWDKGVWRAEGGSRGGEIDEKKALELLMAYGDSRSVRFAHNDYHW